VARASLERTLAQERLAQEIAPRLELAQANAARARATSAAGAASRQQVIEAELAALARQLDAVRAHAELRRAQAELEAAVGRRLEVQPP
jgi:outer membrane protein TolC